LDPSWLLLEYDDKRSGTFEHLNRLNENLNTNIFLGVITTKTQFLKI
jgi:hypothetical protein